MTAHLVSHLMDQLSFRPSDDSYEFQSRTNHTSPSIQTFRRDPSLCALLQKGKKKKKGKGKVNKRLWYFIKKQCGGRGTSASHASCSKLDLFKELHWNSCKVIKKVSIGGTERVECWLGSKET